MTTRPISAETRGAVCVRRPGRRLLAGLFTLLALSGGAATAAEAQSTQPPRSETRPSAELTPAPGTPTRAAPPASQAPVVAPSRADAASVSPVPAQPPAPTVAPPAPAGSAPIEPKAEGAAPVAPPASSEYSAVPAQQRREIEAQLGSVESRLEMIDQERNDGKIAGPIAMLTSGYTTGLIALGVSLGSFAMAQQVKHRDPGDAHGGRLDVNNDGNVDGDDEATFRRVSRGLGIVSAVGFGVGIAGTAILAKRLRERRERDPEVRELQRRRRELHRELNYGADVSSRGLSLGLSGRF